MPGGLSSMPDEQAFLDTIFEYPDEDGPRLVYADWLEESGRTERAEFIRIQMELPHVLPRSRERAALARREKQLLSKHRSEWFSEFDGWTLNRTYFIRRGFVDAVETRAEMFLEGMQEHFRRSPIREVKLEGVSRDMHARLAALPRLSRLRMLEMYGAHIDAAVLNKYLKSPHSSNLTALLIGGNEIASEGAELLAYTEGLPNLEELDIRHNRIGGEGIQALARGAGLPKLRYLNICGNHHSADDVVALLESPHRAALRHLNIWYTNLRDTGLRKLANCPAAERLTGLNLYNNGFTLRGLQSLLKSNHFPRLEELYLGYSPITPELAADFLESPRFPRLKLLSLHHCDAIDDTQQRALKRRYKTRITFQYPNKAR